MKDLADVAQAPAQITSQTETTVQCDGAWTVHGLDPVLSHLQTFTAATSSLAISGAQISAMDSAGAWVLHHWLTRLQSAGVETQLVDFAPKYLTLLALIEDQPTSALPAASTTFSGCEKIGRQAMAGLAVLSEFARFIGEVTVYFGRWLKRPATIRWQALCSNIVHTGYQATFIIALLSFLIGVVLAYQIGVQLQHYGASIFVVDLLGISVLREFAPLLTAIIVAGRTGSAYTAQLGTMKLNEEIDAIRTFGLSPLELLVLPKVFALMIALPLLVVLADVFGIFGGMLMAKNMLDISYIDFLQRFGNVIEVKNYIIGLIKTPVFALLIASIGCFQGLQVTNGAESVGQRTTMSVVQAIFMIIVADAAFSILFSALGI